MIDGFCHMRSIHPVEGHEKRREPWERSVHLLVLSLLLVPACTLSNVDVKAEDDSVLFAGGRLSWDPHRRPEQEGSDPTERGRGVNVSYDLDITYGSGSASQQLLEDQVIYFGGKTFDGPRDLSVSYNLTRVLLDVRLASPVSRGVSVEFFGGLEYSSMDVDLRSGSPYTAVSGSDSVAAIGPAIGAAFVWQPIDALRFSAEGRLVSALSSDAGTVDSKSLDLGVGIFPAKKVSLFVGWRKVSYEVDISGDFDSGLDLELAGPVVALWVRL